MIYLIDCFDCAVGKYSNAMGSNAEAHCILCDEAKYTLTTGATGCQGCLAGKYFYEAYDITTFDATASVTCAGRCNGGCVPVADARSGMITDGSGEGNYPNNLDCQWLITSSSSTPITFFLNSFRTEACCDFVTINSCDTATCDSPVQLGRLSGSSINTDLAYVSTTGFLQINFFSDGTDSDAGFGAAALGAGQPGGGG